MTLYVLGEGSLHPPVTLRTRRYCYLSHSVLGEVVNYGYVVGEGYCIYQ